MIRVFALAVLLAACGVKAPPRPPLKPDTAGPAQPGQAKTDAAQPAPEPATCGACATPAPHPEDALNLPRDETRGF
jgi:hypothetical protein